MKKNIAIVCLTGGPCGGKTSLIARCLSELPEKGINVIVAPEAATHIISSMHISPNLMDSFDFQVRIAETQKFFEESAIKAASTLQNSNPTLILCDRGLLDNLAFIAKDKYQSVLEQVFPVHNILTSMLLRYDAVIHVVSAADGASEFYNLNNKARTETIDQARKIDNICYSSYSNHPKFYVLDNSTDFNEKMEKGIRLIYNILGIPAPIERERKFLLRHFLPNQIPEGYAVQRSIITQTYLTSNNPDVEQRVRKREIDKDVFYFYTEKKELSDVERLESEQVISEDEYNRLLKQANPLLTTIKKERTCFLYEYQRFELDNFFSQYQNQDATSLLEIELLEPNQEVNLPDFLKKYLIGEVTGDSVYYNRQIAERNGRLDV